MITRRRLVHLLGSLLALAALAYFGRSILHYWSQASAELWQPATQRAGAIALSSLGLGYILSALAWHQVCRALHLALGATTAMRIYFLSQFGKYLPGNVAQHAGRLALAMRENLPGVAVATSQLIEIAIVVSSMALLALASGSSMIPAWSERLHELNPWLVAAAVLAAIGVAWITLRTHWIAQRIRHVLNLVRGLVTTRHGLVHLATATALAIANVLATAGALYVLVRAIGGESAPDFATTLQIQVLSWMAGFLTPGSPAGLGVREAVMLQMLSRSLQAPEAVAICVAFRLATTLIDLLAFGVGVLIPARRVTRAQA